MMRSFLKIVGSDERDRSGTGLAASRQTELVELEYEDRNDNGSINASKARTGDDRRASITEEEDPIKEMIQNLLSDNNNNTNGHHRFILTSSGTGERGSTNTKHLTISMVVNSVPDQLVETSSKKDWHIRLCHQIDLAWQQQLSI